MNEEPEAQRLENKTAWSLQLGRGGGKARYVWVWGLFLLCGAGADGASAGKFPRDACLLGCSISSTFNAPLGEAFGTWISLEHFTITVSNYCTCEQPRAAGRLSNTAQQRGAGCAAESLPGVFDSADCQHRTVQCLLLSVQAAQACDTRLPEAPILQRGSEACNWNCDGEKFGVVAWISFSLKACVLNGLSLG